ncbi:hypothetical protein ACN47E_003725 [Coniothyrium glycines]
MLCALTVETGDTIWVTFFTTAQGRQMTMHTAPALDETADNVLLEDVDFATVAPEFGADVDEDNFEHIAYSRWTYTGGFELLSWLELHELEPGMKYNPIAVGEDSEDVDSDAQGEEHCHYTICDELFGSEQDSVDFLAVCDTSESEDDDALDTEDRGVSDTEETNSDFDCSPFPLESPARDGSSPFSFESPTRDGSTSPSNTVTKDIFSGVDFVSLMHSFGADTTPPPGYHFEEDNSIAADHFHVPRQVGKDRRSR